MTRKALPNILWLLGERAARAAVTATVLSLVARHLQPEQFGRLSFALSAVAVATALATLGLEGLVVNDLIRRPGREGAVLGTAFGLRAIAGAATAALGIACAWLFPPWRTDAALVCVAALGLLLQPAEVVDLWFQRNLDSRRTVLTRLAVVLAGAALRIGLIRANAGLMSFVWAQLAELGLLAIGLTAAYRFSPYSVGRWCWDRAIAADFWKRGAPLGLAGVTVAIALRLDQFLVHGYLDRGETGVYFAASRLTEIALLVGTAMTLSFFPGLAHLYANDRKEFSGRLQALFDALSAFGWLFAAGAMVAGPMVVRVLFGPAYSGASSVLVIQSWGALFALSAGVRWQFILLAAPTVLNLGAASMSIAVQFILGRLWVPQYGTEGAALSWTIAAVVSGFGTSMLFPSLRPCARAQARGLAIPFAPSRWRAVVGLFST